VSERLLTALADRYQIERELGAGGMATVYLAHDIKHDRKVAIKVLKPELAAVLGADRFVVEIKTTASLQHPHILPLFDSGEADGFLYYVMPYIQGETIREKLNRETQFGVDDAVRIAREVADALDYAHRHGVIHRDIKPENLLLHDGRAMVMDFGIALAVSAAAGGRMTETGLSLGTPHYMSPEQATAEKEITGRSDIYSLASVLYEMLTGDPPHTGSSAQQVIMKIIAESVQPVTALRKSVPPNVAAALAKALEKLPADRFQNAKSFGDALANSAFTIAAPGEAIARRKIRFAFAGWAVAGVAMATAAWLGLRRLESPKPAVQFVLTSATARPVMTYTWPAVVSPDGQHLVYAGDAGAGQYQLFERRIDDLTTRALSGSEGATQPTFSPDSRWIAYLAGGQLIKVQVGGGVPVPLTAASGNNGMTWLPSGEIVLGSEGGLTGLVRVSDRGGALRQITRVDSGDTEALHVWPVALEDGKTILFSIWRGNGKTLSSSELGTASIRDGVVHRLGVTAVRALGVSAGQLFYLQADGTVMAVAFDGRRVTGAGVPLLDSISLCRTCNGDAPINLSSSGALAYIRGAVPSRITWVDSTGAARAIDGREASFLQPRLSPDGRRVLVTVQSRQSDVWMFDIPTSTWSQATRGGNNYSAEWSGDGGHFLFVSDRDGKTRGLQQATAGGGAPEERVRGLDGLKYFVASPTGTTLLLNGFVDNRPAIWFKAGADTIKPFEFGVHWFGHGRFSPDGAQVAYTSDETGTNEVYVRPFLGSSAPIQISARGGVEPVWSRDGHRLYYMAGQRMMAAKLAPSPELRVIARDSLFTWNGFTSSFDGATYDVAPDGKHFLMLQTNVQSVQLVIALGWASAARQRIAGAPAR
jgi:Tol biopolymer transport system component